MRRPGLAAGTWCSWSDRGIGDGFPGVRCPCVRRPVLPGRRANPPGRADLAAISSRKRVTGIVDSNQGAVAAGGNFGGQARRGSERVQDPAGLRRCSRTRNARPEKPSRRLPGWEAGSAPAERIFQVHRRGGKRNCPCMVSIQFCGENARRVEEKNQRTEIR